MKMTFIVRPAFALIVAALACYPFLYTFMHASIFDLATEFVAYRVGDALSILSGDIAHPKPVQGMPTAIVSLLIVALMQLIHGAEGLLARAVLQIYGGLFYLVISVSILVAVLLAGRRDWFTLLGLSGFVLTLPLIGGIPSGFFLAPEYWLGEYVFLAFSFLILTTPISPTLRNAALIGAWAGVGITMKIPLAGVALIIFLHAFGLRSLWRTASVALAACVITFVVIDFIYLRGSFLETIDLVAFQTTFFVHPNISTLYPSLTIALQENLIMVAAGILAAGYAAALCWRSPLVGLAALLWIGLNVYLVLNRLHSSSTSSAATAAIFLAFALPLLLNRYLIALSAVVVIAAGFYAGFPQLSGMKSIARSQDFLTERPQFDIERDIAKEPGIILMPDNYWNANTVQQAFLFNGRLGLHQVFLDDQKLPFYKGNRAANFYFPHTVVIGWSPAIRKLFGDADVPIYWTRPLGRDENVLDTVRAAWGNREVTVRQFRYNGFEWEYGVARRR